MKELGIDTVYQKLKAGIENLQESEHPFDTADWGHQVGILLSGDEALLLIDYLEKSIEFINEVKAAAGMKQT